MAMRGRAGTVSVATVGVIASLKPRPPSSPRSSLTDVTNGAAGLLSGKGGSADAGGAERPRFGSIVTPARRAKKDF